MVQVVDDLIVETFEQFFMLYIETVEAVDPAYIVFPMPAMGLSNRALVRVLDNDGKLVFTV